MAVEEKMGQFNDLFKRALNIHEEDNRLLEVKARVKDGK